MERTKTVCEGANITVRMVCRSNSVILEDVTDVTVVVLEGGTRCLAQSCQLLKPR